MDMTDTDADDSTIDEVQPEDTMSDEADLVMRAPVDTYAMFFALVKLAVDPRSAKRTVRELRDAAHAAASERTQVAADKAEFVEWKAAQIAEFEPQRKSAVRIYELAKAKEAEVEAEKDRMEVVKKRCRELGLDIDSPTFDPANFMPPGSFTPIEGTTIRQSPERRPAPPVETEPQAEQQSNTVRRGHGDTVDFPPGTTLSRQPEPTAVRVRVRPNNRKGAAA